MSNSLISLVFYKHLSVESVLDIYDIDIDIAAEVDMLKKIDLFGMINLCDLFMDIDSAGRYRNAIESNINIIFNLHQAIVYLERLNKGFFLKEKERTTAIINKYFDKMKIYDNNDISKMCDYYYFNNNLYSLVNLLVKYDITVVNEFLISKITSCRFNNTQHHNDTIKKLFNLVQLINNEEYKQFNDKYNEYFSNSYQIKEVVFMNSVFLLMNNQLVMECIEKVDDKIIETVINIYKEHNVNVVSVNISNVTYIMDYETFANNPTKEEIRQDLIEQISMIDIKKLTNQIKDVFNYTYKASNIHGNELAYKIVSELQRFYIRTDIRNLSKDKNAVQFQKYLLLNFHFIKHSNCSLYTDVIDYLRHLLQRFLRKEISKDSFKQILLKSFDEIEFRKIKDHMESVYFNDGNQPLKLTDETYIINQLYCKHSSFVASVMNIINNFLFVSEEKFNNNLKYLHLQD